MLTLFFSFILTPLEGSCMNILRLGNSHQGTGCELKFSIQLLIDKHLPTVPLKWYISITNHFDTNKEMAKYPNTY